RLLRNVDAPQQSFFAGRGAALGRSTVRCARLFAHAGSTDHSSRHQAAESEINGAWAGRAARLWTGERLRGSDVRRYDVGEHLWLHAELRAARTGARFGH